METFRTNRLIININFENLNKQYDIFKLTTTDKYINEDSYILDIPNLKLKSIFYDGNKNLFILATKDDTLLQTLKDYISIQPNGEKISIERFSARNEKNPNYIIGNLFLNALNNGNSESFKFNNLTGKLYCFNTGKNFIEKRKDQNDKNYISRIIALQIKIDSDMCIRLNVRTFTNYRLKHLIHFSKPYKNWNSYPQYIISKPYNFLKRLMPSEKESLSKIDIQDTFILRQIGDDRKVIPFLEFSSLNKFSQSKIGMLHYTIDVLNKQYSNVISIDFQTIDDYILLEPIRNTKTVSILTENVNNQVISTGIRIIDCVKDENSAILINKLISTLKKKYENLDIKTVKNPSKNKLNIKLIHDDLHYKKFLETDLYSNNSNYVIQHITIDKYPEDDSSLLENILKELIIKKDLLQNKISLVDWSTYNYQSDWIFCQKQNNLFYFMIIHPNGSFEFKTMENDLFYMNEYQKYMKCFDEKNEIIGVVANPNNEINCIKKTNQFTVPKFEEIHDILCLLQDNASIETSELLGYLDELENIPKFKNNYDNNINSVNLVRESLQNIDAISCNDLRKILKNDSNKSSCNNKINRLVKDFINNKVYSDYNIMLFNYLRVKNIRDMLLSSETDIKYFQINNKYYYFVGYTGNGMRNKLPTSCCIKEILAFDDSKIFFQELLPLMDVVFVKYGQLTVIPFPFKYLREYINMNESYQD